LARSVDFVLVKINGKTTPFELSFLQEIIVATIKLTIERK